MSCGSKTKSFKTCRCICKWRCRCIIPREKKPPPAFGIGSKRDDKILGMHPKFFVGGTVSPPVGSYNPQPVQTKTTTRSWTRELESEEFSATMGGRLSKSYAMQKTLEKTGLGPGTHEIPQWPEIILNKACKSIRTDVGFGTTPLFELAPVSTTPGPGYTRKCPYHYMDERKRIGSSCLPTFEYDGLQSRFRTISKPWSLPCNLYNAKHPKSLEATLSKVTGKRGPYDLFTGPRDESTLTGHQRSLKFTRTADWVTPLPVELLREWNYFKGRWITCPRFPKQSGMLLVLQDLALCYKDPNHPGPGHYSPRSPRRPKNAKQYPFNINIEHVRPGISWKIHPGPGRYTVQQKDRIKGNGWTWIFKSKVPRTNFIIVPKYTDF
ncbi:ciliary microtubule-associated protein 2 [Ptiloglossa arizonensis]|uniref:ciliary microtubule-associated protein 2 n=1 Tax=Ptiloglossa arizonensis TaxID=3350558 RepID=UPI003FA0B313